MFVSATVALAQSPPTITSISPTSGAVGTSITITGANFDTTLANNIVWFGAVRGTVTAATATSLSVTAPRGALYGPITVTTPNQLTAASTLPFTPTFSGLGGIGNSSFASQLVLPTGNGPVEPIVADLDGDGKPDLVVANHLSATVSIYRNISSAASLTASSFAPRFDLPTGSGPWGVRAVDIDGDGKLDLVGVNQNSSTFWIYRNVSTPGSLSISSFSSPVTISTGGSLPIDLAVGDLDGDGKPDVAVCHYYNRIVVFRNTSSVSGISFTSVAFDNGANPTFIVIADFDGDGKNDIAFANHGAPVATVMRNTSQVGTLDSSSLAYPGVSFPVGSGGVGLAAGDLDGDGQLDLLVSTLDSETQGLSILRNTSVPGTINSSSFPQM